MQISLFIRLRVVKDIKNYIKSIFSKDRNTSAKVLHSIFKILLYCILILLLRDYCTTNFILFNFKSL